MGFPQEIHLTPEEEAALDDAVAEAQATRPIPITDEDVRRAKEAAKAWDDPAVQRMMREMEQRRKQVQEKGEQK